MSKWMWLALVSVGGWGAAVHADYTANFEAPTYSGSAAGVSATGQDGWYLPAGIDSKIYTYAGNTPGFAVNPEGGDQFLAGRSEGGTNFARAQHDVDFSTRDTWVFSYDFAALYDGLLPAAVNLGSFSTQPSTLPTTKTFIALNNWVDVNNPALGWKAEYNVFDATGAAINNQSPGAEWTSLVTNHWYRQSLTWETTSNQITVVTLMDLTTGETWVANPSNWYAQGGLNSTLPLPTSIRVFTGGSAGDNTAWDNVSVIPEPTTLLLIFGVAAIVRRRAP